MSYSDFRSLDFVKREFSMIIKQERDLFPDIQAVKVSDHLKKTLARYEPLALAINTEKIRSELLIAPLLVELREYMKEEISFFSGNEFNVEKERGLNGVCDFLISRSNNQDVITAPVVTIVEAKKQEIQEAFPQCIAEMIGAQLFNQREGKEQPIIYGVVTTGEQWKFLKLEENTLRIDYPQYILRAELEKIFSILVFMLS